MKVVFSTCGIAFLAHFGACLMRIALEFKAPSPDWQRDFTEVEYADAEEILGVPDYFGGFLIPKESSVVNAVPIERGDVIAEEQTLKFFQVWLEGYDVGSFVFFPKALTLEYPRRREEGDPKKGESVETRVSFDKFWVLNRRDLSFFDQTKGFKF